MINLKIMTAAILFLGLTCSAQIFLDSPSDWPVYPAYYSNRSEVATPDPYCRAHFKFCPGSSMVPSFKDDDTLEVFSMKKPVWQFVTGDLLANFGIWHDAIGFRSKDTGMNFTVEWYELFELMNSTFPHIVEGRSSPVWCNQGAACLYDGIVDRIWLDNGTIVKVAEISGKQFSEWTKWLKQDNDTGPYYETWRVAEGAQEGAQEWFEPFDCASFILRSFKYMKTIGVQFDQSVKLNYTFSTLYSAQPVFLGNEADIFGPKANNQSLAKTLMTWYSDFQPYHKDLTDWISSVIDIFADFEIKREFYIYYNKAYWFLSLKDPILRISYEYVPLPT